MVICLAGLALMFVEKLSGSNITKGSENTLKGLITIAVTTLFWGGYSVSIRRCMKAFPVKLSFSVICLYTCIGLLVLMLIRGDYMQLTRIDGTTWTIIITSAFVGITFSHVMLYKAIHILGPLVSAGLLMATPFITNAISIGVLGSEEIMTWLQTVGGVMIIGGGVLLLWTEKKISKEKEQVE